MNKKPFALWLALVLNLAIVAQNRPNIVMIVSDDHTMQSIGAYGATYGASPNIDRLAKEGMVFNRAFVTNSICAPSRAVMLTGKYSHINGHRDNHSVFNAGQDNFGKQLQQLGYQTAWIGKWHLEAQPQGFDYWKVLPGQGLYFNPAFLNMDGKRETLKGYCTDIITELATGWLNRRDTAMPFCLVVGHKATHRPWMPDTADLGAFDRTDIPVPANFYDKYEGRTAAAKQDMSIEKTLRMANDLKMVDDSIKAKQVFGSMHTEQRNAYLKYYDSLNADLKNRNLTGSDLLYWKYKRYVRDYLGTALSLDRNVGKLMEYLEDQGLLENTVVIYISDQGFYMGEHGWFDKRFMYEESMRTPLIIRYPAMLKPGSFNNDLVMNLDLAPTLVDWAGGKIPSEMQGMSLLPLLKGTVKRGKWRDAVYYHYYEYPGEHAVYRHFGIRTRRYKLIRFYNAENFWELYDLKNDPHEMKNLANDPGYAKIMDDMKVKLKSLIVEVKDNEALEILNKEPKNN